MNYRRNISCFHCEHDRPADEYSNSQMEAKQSALRKRLERPPRKSDVSSAWNFDFDDNESDGADVAAFEFADSSKARESSSADMSYRGASKVSEDEEYRMAETMTTGRGDKFSERESLPSSRNGFDDFDDEEDDIDSYELDLSKGSQTGGVSRMSYSDLESASDSEGFSEIDNSRESRYDNSRESRYDNNRESRYAAKDEDEFEDHPSLRSTHLADSWHKTRGQSGSNNYRRASFGSESDDGINSDLDEDIDKDFRNNGSRSQGSPNRASVRHNALAYSDDEPFSDDVDSGMVDRFQSTRTKSSMNIKDNFGDTRHNLNGRRSSGHCYGRTERNERFNDFDMHRGSSVSDKSRRARGNQLDSGSRGLQRNVRRNWDRSGGFDGRH